MARPPPHHRGVTSARDWASDVVAEPWPEHPTDYPRYSLRQHQALLKAGQLIVDWAVEVARYEADLDWQWVRGAGNDPSVTAGALARLIRDTQAVVDRAEALLLAARPDVADGRSGTDR